MQSSQVSEEQTLLKENFFNNRSHTSKQTRKLSLKILAVIDQDGCA